MSDWGNVLGDFIKVLYWTVGILVAMVVVLSGALVWTIVK